MLELGQGDQGLAESLLQKETNAFLSSGELERGELDGVKPAHATPPSLTAFQIALKVSCGSRSQAHSTNWR